ncbi:hypothetical protein KR009_008942 [Drosophila setifemur]|nr:hypothetical protein KR009_008942 [Drosophila setifemur]
MHLYLYMYLYLVVGFCCLEFGAAVPVFDDTGRLNLSATCPGSFCSLSEQSLAYSGTLATRLRELHLNNCSRQAVPWVVLNLTPGLRTLVIRNCGTYHIDKERLRPVGNLTSLQMQRTNVWVLRDGEFGAVPNLEILELGDNTIHTVHVAAFKGLSKLKLLGLQGNGIEEVLVNTFDPLGELLHLDLSGNQMTYIPPHIFAKNTKLETLLLNGNRLNTLLADILLPLRQLRVLDLGHVGQLDSLVLNLHNVQSLILQGSGLSRLDIEGGFIRLEAANNELTHIQVGSKGSVIEMHLHGNLMDGSSCYELLRGMWNLQTLDLSKNVIEAIPSPRSDSFDGSDPDQVLFLLPSLKYLSLANNRLVRLPPDSPILSSRLNYLDLAHNHLLTFEVERLTGLPNLESLYLEGNRLNSIDYQLFHKQHESIKELSLQGNQWTPGLYRKMYVYLSDRGVHLQSRLESGVQINSSQVDIDWPLTESSAGKLDSGRVSGVHVDWTLKDFLTVVILVVVLLILLMNFYNILEEEGCLGRFRRWWRFNASEREALTINRGVRHLNEQDSEV